MNANHKFSVYCIIKCLDLFICFLRIFTIPYFLSDMFFVMRVIDSGRYVDDDTADSIDDFTNNLENRFRQVIQMVL